jgi:hypothetical protein
MMKETRKALAGGNGGRRGAALIIALAAAAVLFLSTAILLGYLGRTSRDVMRERMMAQAMLSRQSAIDWIRASLASGTVPCTDAPALLETGGQTTSITLVSTGPVQPRRVDLADAPASAFLYATSYGPAAAAPVDGGIELAVLDPVTGAAQPGFPVVLDVDGGWLAAGFEDRSPWAVVLAAETGGSVSFYLVGADGSVARFDTELLSLDGYGAATAGLSDGEPVILLSSDAGTLVVRPVSGAAAVAGTRSGTCPVFLDGRLFVPSGERTSLNCGRILDTVSGDWDSDGSTDVLWISESGWTAWLSSSAAFLEDRVPGRRAVAWGDLDAAGGAAVCTEGSAGLRSWRRLGLSGWQDCPSMGAMNMPWSGRLLQQQALMLGVLPDGITIASANGMESTRLSDSAAGFFEVLDGSGVDAAVRTPDGWDAILDPLDGFGTTCTWRLDITGGGRQVYSDSFTASVYGGTGGPVRVIETGSE